ncbi:hypothetical protein GCM10011316_20700 [Roseibium aquae]|uniref:Alpha/beta fold hydrolase n=1 Tax=Roseibium aquae TaxID=1323746 RepID=A0A916TJK2_9HYPH|nr:alpha/beta fold hydrolase [Roseibium aquae]GGB48432.1 hypothetical protein GCM10011316_20700 [Roseibium aquae]
MSSLETGLSRGEPFYVDGLGGWLHRAAGSTAVLFLPPWGYEELAARKFYRVLAEKLAARGFPVLRFDYWSTGQSSDPPGPASASGFLASARRALQELRRLTSASEIVLLGQGFGGLVAAELARHAGPKGLVLLAPAPSGRAYLREVQAFAAMTKPTFLAGSSEGPNGGIFAGGFGLTKEQTEEIQTFNLMKRPGNDHGAPLAPEILVVERPDHPGDEGLVRTLGALGPVSRRPFSRFEAYASNPTLSEFPVAAFHSIVDWMTDTFPTEPPSGLRPAVPLSTSMAGPGYRETVIRFGEQGQFCGVLCDPSDGEAPDTVIVFLNAGYDHSIGWGRAQVEQSRALAGRGIPSLRFDLAGIGESAFWPDQPDQVLYSPKQLEDVHSALGEVVLRYPDAAVILYGRCSGGYLALAAAEQDRRVAKVFAVNARRLVWDSHEDVDQAIREPIQTLDTYRRKLVDGAVLRRVFTGDLPVARVISRLTQAAAVALAPLSAPILRSRSAHYRQARQAKIRFSALFERKVPVQLVYSVGDRGRGEVEKWLGRTDQVKQRYPNLTIADIADADHNLTPLPARQAVFAHLVAFAAK